MLWKFFAGEWTAALERNDASDEDHKTFAQAQLDVYGRATFGWGYWAYRSKPGPWSLKWMIERNLIKL